MGRPGRCRTPPVGQGVLGVVSDLSIGLVIIAILPQIAIAVNPDSGPISPAFSAAIAWGAAAGRFRRRHPGEDPNQTNSPADSAAALPATSRPPVR